MSGATCLMADEEFSDPSESDRYRILEQIGSGAAGKVFKAKDKREKKGLVAIKQIRYDDSEGTPSFVMREIADLNRLNDCPHVVRLLDVYREPFSMLNLVFEYVPQDLAHYIAEASGGFLWIESDIKDLMEQLLKGVEAIHNNNIIHRDLKPSNILVTEHGVLKISDFGLSRPFYAGKTLSTQVVTICYRAPELLLSLVSYSYAVDMWSVGCIFAELYLKRPLFQATNEISMLKEIFGVIGTPKCEEWPDCMINWNSFEELPPKDLIKILPGASQEACSLITKLIKFTDSHRPTVEEALQHEMFQLSQSQDSGVVV